MAARLPFGGRICRAHLCLWGTTHQQCRSLSLSAPVHRGVTFYNPFNVAKPFADRLWNINVAVCLFRPPTVAQLLPEECVAYEKLRDDVSNEIAIPSKHDERLAHFKRLQVALEQRARGETVTEFSQKELTDDEIRSYEERQQIEEIERREFTPAGRVTEDDTDEVLTSTNRLLHRYLYLIVRHKSDDLGWHFPQIAVDGTVALRDEVDLFIPKLCESEVDFAVASNAPSAVYSLRGETADGRKGSKVFVYMAHLKSKNIGKLLNSDYVEYRWLPKEEIRPLLPGIAKSTSGMLFT